MNKLLWAVAIGGLMIISNEILTLIALVIASAIGMYKLFNAAVSEYEEQHSADTH